MYVLYLVAFIGFYTLVLGLPLTLLAVMVKGKVNRIPVTGKHYGVRFSKTPGGQFVRVSVGSNVFTL